MSRSVFAAGAATLLLAVVLLLPVEPRLLPSGFAHFPLELPLIVLLLAFWPVRWRGALAWLLAVLLAAVTAMKLAELGVQTAFGRPLDLAVDGSLLRTGAEMAGRLSGLPVPLVFVLAALAVVLLVLALRWALTAISHATKLVPRPVAIGTGVLLIACLALQASGSSIAIANAGGPVIAQAQRTAASLRDVAALREDFARDPVRDAAGPLALQKLAGRDVLLIFVESYGAGALTRPGDAEAVRAALTRFDGALAEKGLVARSAILDAPTAGGLSWLSHATFLSGLTIDSQRRYDLLVGSSRATLVRDFADAGWDTAAVIPANTRDWPEGAFFGYDHVLDAAALGYHGKPFGWVTMPDQFTLASFQRKLRDQNPRRPLMAEVALLSSHFPWAPLPRLVSPDALGDGSIFDAQVEAGQTPEALWRDTDKVREAYRTSLVYSLDVVADHVKRHADASTLLIMLGDHEPMATIAGEGAPRRVPVHVIGDPALLAALDSWGWSQNMLPAADAPVWPMASMREKLLTAFTPARAVAGRVH